MPRSESKDKPSSASETGKDSKATQQAPLSPAITGESSLGKDGRSSSGKMIHTEAKRSSVPTNRNSGSPTGKKSQIKTSLTPDVCIPKVISASQEILCCGLENLGSTCYVNSVLQMLYGWPIFHSYMLTHDGLGLFHQVLSDLFDEMDMEVSRNTGCTAVVAPKEFLAFFRDVRPEFGAGQQDAQEFLSVLLDLLHSEVNQSSNLPPEKLAIQPEPASAEQAWDFHVAHVDNSFFSNYIMGQVQSTLTCLECGQQSQSWCCIWQLQVQLEETASTGGPGGNGSNQSKTLTLNDCIAKYFGKETLTNDSAPYCARCDQWKPATKQQFFCRPPPYVLVHLKRFAADRTKNHRPVNIDLHLNLGGQRYILLSVVLHDGTEADGHYSTLVAVQPNGDYQWMALDDQKTYECMPQVAALVMKKFAYLVLYAVVEQDEQ